MTTALATILSEQSATFHETARYELEERIGYRDPESAWREATTTERAGITFDAAYSTAIAYEDTLALGVNRDARIYSLIAATQTARRLDRGDSL